MAGLGIRSCVALAMSATLFVYAGSAHAAGDIAVLGLEIVDGGEGLDEQTAQRAGWLTDELRQHAASDGSPYALAPDGNKDLLEMKLLSGCDDEALGCMAGIGEELGADALLYGNLQKGEEGYEVTLTLIRTEEPAVEGVVSDEIPFTEASKSAMGSWARSLYNELAGVSEGGLLVVETNASTGTIFIGGEPQASLTGGEAQVSHLDEGIHTVSIEAEGYAPYAERVTIASGQREVMSIELETVDEAGTSRVGHRVAFGSAAAATGASAGLWIYFLNEWSTAHDQASSWSPPDDFAGDDPCEDSSVQPPDFCEDGTRAARWNNVFGAATVVGALATGYFAYRGFGSSGGGDAGDESWSFQLTPRVSSQQIGAGVQLEF